MRGASGISIYILNFSLLLTTSPLFAQVPILIVDKGRSDHKILISAKATKNEKIAASMLQQYISKVSGATLPLITDEGEKTGGEINIGHTNRSPAITNLAVASDGFHIRSEGLDLWLNGPGQKGVIYSVSAFLERYLGIHKLAAGFTATSSLKTIRIPGDLNVAELAAFNYREVYYPDSKEQEYLDWHKLNRLDDSWGLWAHSFDKLVPAKEHFESHPEYYALVAGKRNPGQLCLSNAQAFNILVSNLKARMADDEEMQNWSVSQNDDPAHCECNLCATADKKEGGPQGSLLNFVNRVAEKFPHKTISTLAYTYSQRAPRNIKPAPNVQIMLCSIDCNRSIPIADDPRSAAFRKDLKEWSRIAPNLFIWDYTVQFTNYISPFPNLRVLQSNLQFFKENGVTGVFEQGSGDTPGELSELRGYLLSKLSWNPDADVNQLTAGFLQHYYGKAAPFIQKYLDLLHDNMQAAKGMLDIYSNPITPRNTYLSSELLDQYGQLFDQAEAAVENNPILLQHVLSARLPVEYAVLQQSRFYGLDKHGAFIKDEEGKWIAKPSLVDKVNTFVSALKSTGVTELSEGGMSPDQYLLEWNEIFKAGPKDHLGLYAKVLAITPFSDEYPNKGASTLTDGTRGYLDYQYNWLGWYGNDMEVVVDLLNDTLVSTISTSFLEDQRHWAFIPEEVSYSLSADGKRFRKAGRVSSKTALYENYEKSVQDYTLHLSTPLRARYVKVKVKRLKKLPVWRYYKGRKAWLFADEIMVR